MLFNCPIPTCSHQYEAPYEAHPILDSDSHRVLGWEWPDDHDGDHTVPPGFLQHLLDHHMNHG